MHYLFVPTTWQDIQLYFGSFCFMLFNSILFWFYWYHLQYFYTLHFSHFTFNFFFYLLFLLISVNYLICRIGPAVGKSIFTWLKNTKTLKVLSLNHNRMGELIRWDRVCERERECVCLCVWERERERMGVWERGRERVCVCVCDWEDINK